MSSAADGTRVDQEESERIIVASATGFRPGMVVEFSVQSPPLAQAFGFGLWWGVWRRGRCWPLPRIERVLPPVRRTVVGVEPDLMTASRSDGVTHSLVLDLGTHEKQD